MFVLLNYRPRSVQLSKLTSFITTGSATHLILAPGSLRWSWTFGHALRPSEQSQPNLGQAFQRVVLMSGMHGQVSSPTTLWSDVIAYIRATSDMDDEYIRLTQTSTVRESPKGVRAIRARSAS
jgi:hypothetical protein